MESREVSESMKNLEQDVTLSQEPAVETTGNCDVSNEEISPANEVEQPMPEPAEAEVPQPVEEAQPAAEEQPVSTEAAEPSKPMVHFSTMNKAELVAHLEELAQQPVDAIRDEVGALKSAFYALRKEEVAQEQAAFVEAGNAPEDFVAAEDADEAKVKELLNQIKERRAEFNAAQEATRLSNLELKRGIIQQITDITNDPDNINRQYNKVQQLQQEFKAIGPVPATDETEVWKTYQLTVEKFYDLLKINKELRDYDFKKNLEIKQQLCLEAEQLDELPDIVVAFRKLQDLHNTWRETGPVAKDLREDLWARFKNASAVVNKKYQAFFEERKAREKEVTEQKRELCERVEAIDVENLKSRAAWEATTKEVIELQKQWKDIGYVLRRTGSDLYARFRSACDNFFQRKNVYFKTLKESQTANLALKLELCEKAEALMDSTDWREATEAFIDLQKQWKTVGPVAQRDSDKVWKRFIAACDHFFEQKKKLHGNVHAVEHENLKAKKAIIAQLRALIEAEETPDDAAQQVRDLMSQWQGIGHVPFKEKDKVYADYREAVDKAFEQFDIRGSRAHMANFASNLNRIEGEDRMSHERERLVRAYEQKMAEVKTYENNMGFFNAQSKSGNSIVKEMECKIERLKEDIAMLEQKIKMVDEKM
ncbi:MAG: DUF349 domain-containing protein [Muribaculaceae bacterium]|nr:DUF349 domain-containing protein [Muribaculaceae bacterium]